MGVKNMCFCMVLMYFFSLKIRKALLVQDLKKNVIPGVTFLSVNYGHLMSSVCTSYSTFLEPLENHQSASGQENFCTALHLIYLLKTLTTCCVNQLINQYSACELNPNLFIISFIIHLNQGS